MVGAFIVTGLLLFGMPEGPAQVIEIAREAEKFSLGSFSATLTESTFWVVLIYGLFINLNNFGIDQSFIQRYHTAKSDGDAARSVWLGALLYVPISLLFFFIAAACSPTTRPTRTGSNRSGCRWPKNASKRKASPQTAHA